MTQTASAAANRRGILCMVGAMGWAGFNCSLPHKVAAMAVMDEVDPRARRIGAIR